MTARHDTTQRNTRQQTLWCHACRRTGFKRTELSPDWLCRRCKARGARGYRDPNTRGLSGDGAESGAAYFERTKDRLRIIEGEEAAATTAEPDTAPRRSRRALTAFQQYQAAVLARSDLTASDKLVFMELVRCADHRTGGNCAPKLATVAARYGKPTRWAARHVARLDRRFKLVRAIPMRSARGRKGFAQSLYVFTGHGFEGPTEHGKLRRLVPSPTPRPVGDGFAGRRARHQKVV